MLCMLDAVSELFLNLIKITIKQIISPSLADGQTLKEILTTRAEIVGQALVFKFDISLEEICIQNVQIKQSQQLSMRLFKMLQTMPLRLGILSIYYKMKQ